MNNKPDDQPSDQPPGHPVPGLAGQIGAAAELVRDLLAAGLLTPQALGLPTVPAEAPASLVPGERITVADLADKALASCSRNTRRTYGTYMRLLAYGWPAKAPAEEKLYPGLGDRWADEVLPSELEEALRFVEARTLLGGHWRAARREDAGRVVRDTDAAGARYNAVGAWRRMFKVAVKDRHLRKGFDPSQDVDKPRRSDGTRMALEQEHYDQLWQLLNNSGDDPELDVLIAETIVIAGARQEEHL